MLCVFCVCVSSPYKVQQYNSGRPLMQTDDWRGLHNLWVFSCPFCATQHYGTVELMVDAIIFPYF